MNLLSCIIYLACIVVSIILGNIFQEDSYAFHYLDLEI